MTDEERTPVTPGVKLEVRIEGISRRGDATIARGTQRPYSGLVVFLPAQEAERVGETLTVEITKLSPSGRAGFAKVLN